MSVAELCIHDAVANRSPSAAGSTIRHSQQPKMIESIPASALMAASLRNARFVHRPI
jgi:hypothetical protein